MVDHAVASFLARQRIIHFSACILAIIYIKCGSIMAGSKPDTAHWTNEEIKELLEFLLKHKATITDSGNFKGKTYTSAASTIAKNTKTASQVRTKWNSVSLASDQSIKHNY